MEPLDFSRCRPVKLADGTMSPVKDHVKIGVQALVEHPYFFIADEMGAMKTAQAIIAAQFLFERGVIDRVVVVCPASVRGVWYDPELGELVKHLWHTIPSTVYEYHSKVRSWFWGDPRETAGLKRLEWTITNYEFIRGRGWLKKLLAICTERTLLVLDESAAIKSYRTETTKACVQLRNRCGRIVLLNGTPIANGVEDMFSQGNILHPSILGCKFITHYRARYLDMQPVMGRNGKALTDPRGNVIVKPKGVKNIEELQARFRPYMLRRLKKDCLDLPPVLDTTVFQIPLSPETWAAYRSMRDDMIVWLSENRTASAEQAAVRVMRLSQITSGFIGGIVEEEPEPIEVEENLEIPDWMTLVAKQEQTLFSTLPVHSIGTEKQDFLIHRWKEMLAEEPDLKLLVWCRFRAELDRLLETMRADKDFAHVAIDAIHGGQNRQKRSDALRLLDPRTAPEGPVMLAGTYGTGALGLNLTASHTVFYLSFDYSYWKWVQTAARVDRPGQTSPVSPYEFLATGPSGQKTIDHVIAKARREKEAVAEMTTAAWIDLLREE